MYGHMIEIVERLLSKNASPSIKWQKYPVVILVMDILEDRRSIEEYSKADINIRIVHMTSPTYRAPSRYDEVIEPVLYPIYQDLMDAIAVSSHLTIPLSGLVEHSKEDKLFWGRESIGGNIANKNADFVDAIELTLFELRFQKLINCIN